MRAILSVRSLLLAVGMLLLSVACFAQVGVSISVGFAPPEIPVYTQPVCPGDGYIWTPGYWAWDGEDYYWVPGTWVLAPQVGYFWTPPYWGWNGVAFAFYDGYWGPQVGFYGGINYGFGYFGNGYLGGRWDNGHFFYNRAVTNVNVTVIHNVYVNRVTVNNSHISYNGGRGGINARPTSQEEAYGREKHIGPVAAQNQQVEAARGNKDLRASVNHGRPPIAATPKPAEFSGHGITKATSSAHYTPPPKLSDEAARATHPNELPSAKPLPAPHTGNAKQDQQYQQERNDLARQQQQERQQLQQRQEQEHQQAARQNANAAQKQQMEQRHQQETHQMAQRHAQEQQQMVQRQEPRQAQPHPEQRPK
jgi:WXXGXW repeat (2 copies)